jgi:hypothetical protein
MEWFLNFYPGVRDLAPDKRPIEFIARAGDVVFVPCGWWHCVLNLDHTVAVTQNYLSSSNIKYVFVCFCPSLLHARMLGRDVEHVCVCVCALS